MDSPNTIIFALDDLENYLFKKVKLQLTNCS